MCRVLAVTDVFMGIDTCRNTRSRSYSARHFLPARRVGTKLGSNCYVLLSTSELIPIFSKGAIHLFPVFCQRHVSHDYNKEPS